MENKHSVPIALVRSALAGCIRQNIDIKSLFEESGMLYLWGMYNDPKCQNRVSLDDFGALLRAIWFHLGDESGGFLAGL